MVKIEISVRRQPSQNENPYIQSFVYTGDGNLTVADWLTEINQTETGTNRIAWECGCLEKKCGACAMLINGCPALACSQFLKDAGKRGKIMLEPFRKFPLVKDLIVDRSTMFDVMKDMKLWMQEKNSHDFYWDREIQYKAGQCLQCGCCLEVCPNFLSGNPFAGAAAMVNAYKDMEQNANDSHCDEMKQEYQKKFFAYCGQAFSCQSVCPKQLPLDEIQSRINGRFR